jgi:hypothetical protein
MSAPTEEEIRAAIARQWGALPPVGTTPHVEFEDAFTYCTSLADGLYDLDDLRESEVDRLNELTFAAVDPIRDDARLRINEALVSAALTFAAEHPDAPRATRKLAIV